MLQTGIRKLLLCALCAVLLACETKTTEEYIGSANRYIAASDYDAAIIELKNALQNDRGSAEARWLLGSTYFRVGDDASAAKELLQAQELQWPADDVIPMLAKALLREKRYAQIRDLPTEGLSTNALADLYATQALSELAQGDAFLAARLIGRALEMDPTSPDLQVTEAKIMLDQGDLAGAQANLDQVLSRAPENGSAWSLLGDVQVLQADPEAALPSFDMAIKLQRKPALDRLKRAMVLLQLRDYDRALQDAKELLSESRGNPAGNYIKGVIFFHEKQYLKSIEALSLAEPAWQEFPLLLYYLGAAHLLQDNIGQAEQLAKRFINASPDSIGGRKLLAMVNLEQGEFGLAQALLQPVLDADPDDIGALTIFANALLQDGKTEEGLNALARLVELQPDSARAQVRLSAALYSSDREGEATRHIQSALAIDPRFQQADILLVLNYVKLQDYENAILAARDYRKKHPESVTARNLLGRVYLAHDMQDEAQEAFTSALALAPADPSANHNLAQIEAEQGDIAAARARYKTILKGHDDLLSALLQLAVLEARQGNEAQMQEYLQRAIDAHPTKLKPRLYMGRYYLARAQPEKLPPLFSSLEDLQRKSPEVLRLLALAQISSAAHVEAQYTLEQLLQTTPETAESHHLLAMAAAGSGDTARSKQELERALQLDPEFIPSRVALARMALAAASEAELEEHLQSLVELAPDSVDVIQLQSAAARNQGEFKQAVKYAQSAYEKAPGRYTLLELAQSLTLAGQAEQALWLLQTWTDEHPRDIPAQLSLAEHLRNAGRVAESSATYQSVLQQQPDNQVALVNLAWQLRATDNASALQLASHAYELAPNSPQVLDTLAMVRFYGEQYGLAERHIRRALVMAPYNPGYRYHFALIQAAAGRNKEAVSTLQELQASGVDFPQEKEALALMERLQQSAAPP